MRRPGDTIAAIATAPGVGATAIVRLSGSGSLQAAARVFEPATPLIGATKRLVLDGVVRLPALRVGIPASVYVFRAPRSYTGEDVVELHLPGAPALVEAVLAALLELEQPWVRQAAPGEMTRRAFENGRLDLAEVEAVAALIAATGEDDRRAALATLSGGLSRAVEQVRADLLDLLALVEAELDFVEEEIDLTPDESLIERLGSARAALQVLAVRTDASRGRAALPLALLVGRPGAGKSTLFNALLGAEAAVVTGEPGTTRDRNEHVLAGAHTRLRLADVAGLAAASTPLERRAQELVAGMIEEADLVLVVHDTPAPDAELAELLLAIEAERLVFIRSKCDLDFDAAGSTTGEAQLRTSGKTGEGIAALRELLLVRAARPDSGAGGRALVAGAHTQESLASALEALREAGAAIPAGRELVAEETRAAIDALGEVLGLRVTEEVLDRIFSQFCIGK